MMLRTQPTWRDNNATVGSYVPREVYEKLVQISVDRTKAEHEWWSVSRVVRDILTKAVMEADDGKRA